MAGSPKKASHYDDGSPYMVGVAARGRLVRRLEHGHMLVRHEDHEARPVREGVRGKAVNVMECDGM